MMAIGEFHRRELAALVRIDDLGHTVPGKGLLDDFPGVNGFSPAKSPAHGEVLLGVRSPKVMT